MEGRGLPGQTVPASAGNLSTRTFRPLEKKAVAAILARTTPAVADGQFEPSKTTTGSDGTAHNPQWLG